MLTTTVGVRDELAKQKQCRTNTLDESGWFANLCSVTRCQVLMAAIQRSESRRTPKKPWLLEQSYPVHLKKRFQPSPPGDSSLRFLLPVFPPPNTLLSVCHPLYFGGDKFPACIGFSAVLSLLSRSSLSAPRLFARSI